MGRWSATGASLWSRVSQCWPSEPGDKPLAPYTTGSEVPFGAWILDLLGFDESVTASMGPDVSHQEGCDPP